MIATYLRCESLVEPLGIDRERPRFSWLVEDDRRGAAQSAYQVQVHDDDTGELLWDSEKVEGGDQHHLDYAGLPLRSFQVCRWSVRLWDETGRVGEWSSVPHWGCGFLGEDRFEASWIRYPIGGQKRPIYFVRNLNVQKPVRRAQWVITARGIFEPHLDGQRIGEDYFQPGWTDYMQRFHYRVYDCTDQLRQGEHRLGLILAEGWWCGQIGSDPSGKYGSVPMVLSELHLIYKDGSEEVILTNGDWYCRTGEILQASLQHGEHVDSRKAQPDWCKPGNISAEWRSVESTPASAGCWFPRIRKWIEKPVLFSAHPAEPVRELMRFKAKSSHEAERGSWVYDFGQNMAGIVRLRFEAEAGCLVRLRFGEMVNPDGTLYTENLRSAQATDLMIARGGEETFQPKFTFHGFRYLEITGLSVALPLEQVEAIVLGSATPETTTFTCSNPMLVQLHHNTRWTMRANFLDIPTDCPQRDERLGWTGDAQVFASTACGMADVEAFFRKWMLDLSDEQHEEGGIPNVVPSGGGEPVADAAWGDVMTVLPTVIAERYGDPVLLNVWMPKMKAFCDHYRKRVLEDGTREGGHSFGDWLSLDSEDPTDRSGGTPKPLIQTAFYAYSCHLTARAAARIGNKVVASEMMARYQATAEAFCRRFVKEDLRIEGDTQTAYVLALQFDLLPEASRPVAFAHLVENLERSGRHLTTGFVGVSYLLPVLARFGRMDLAYVLLENEDFPSWGYSIANGATTIWERWNGWLKDQGPGDANMNSYSHYAYGSVMSFVYERVCGLTPLERGYSVASIAPLPGGNLTEAAYTYQSMVGVWKVAWRQRGEAYAYEIEVPPNAKAECRLPMGSALGWVSEEGISGKLDGQDWCAILPAGRYCFEPAV